VVSRSLNTLHWIGVASGAVFLAASITYSRAATGLAHPLATRHLLILLMLVLTLTSQVAISGRMLALRNEMGMIDNLPATDQRRIEFNRLHHWSTRVEGTVLLLGLLALYFTAKAL
jgi:hypothetical protein